MKKIPYLLRRTHYALRHCIDTELAEYNLTASQYEIMAHLGDCQCLEHRELLDELDVASPTLTKLVNHLEDAGHIHREVSDKDARVKLIGLTDQGQLIYDAIQAKFPNFIDKLLQDFSPAERLLLAELLDRLADNAEVLSHA